MEGARLVLRPLCKVKKKREKKKQMKRKKEKKHQISSPQYSPNIQSSLPIGWDQGRRRGRGHRFKKTLENEGVRGERGGEVRGGEGLFFSFQ